MTIRNELTAQWEQRLQSWRDSGLNQKDWCDQHNVKQPQFWYWKKKLTTAPDSGSSLHESTDTPAFVAVALAPEVSTSLTVALPSRLIVSGIDQYNLLLAGQLIEALR